jgi:hypothetical protein
MEMKRAQIFGLLLTLAAAIAPARAEDAKVFHGEISDSQCALNVHSLTRSHQEMLKSKHMGGTPAECANYCVKNMGGNYVLSTRKDVFHLSNQDLALKFVGQKVKVTGMLDSKNDTIHVDNIEAEP